eukprot:9328-Heterococcus_DN1.PRE.1
MAIYETYTPFITLDELGKSLVLASNAKSSNHHRRSSHHLLKFPVTQRSRPEWRLTRMACLENDDARQEMKAAFLEKDVMQQRNAMKAAIERLCKWAFKSRKPSLARSSRSNMAICSIPGKGLGIVADQGVTMSLHDLIHTAGLFGELELLDDDMFYELTLAGHPALYSDRCYKGIVFGPVALLNSAGPGERNVLTFSNIDIVEADARIRSKRKRELEAESLQQLERRHPATNTPAFSEMERSTRRS